MKYWLRHPDQPGYLGPMTLAEIRDALVSGRINWTFDVIGANGQSLAELNKCRIWQPLKTICDPDSVDLPDSVESWPPSVPYQTPAEEYLTGVRVASAYPKVRRGIEIIQGLLTYGMLIVFCLTLILAVEQDFFVSVMLNLLVVFGVILCLFYLIKHAVLALLDISDLLNQRARKS